MECKYGLFSAILCALACVMVSARDCPGGWRMKQNFQFPNLGRVFDDWTVVRWNPRTVNNEKQAYTTSDANVFTRDGHLIIRAFKEGDTFTSGRLESKQTFSPIQAPGKKLRVEFTGKVPTKPGSWPAYWLLGDETAYGPWPKCGELDVMEWVQDISGKYGAASHWAVGGGHRSSANQLQISTSEMSNTWVTYGIEYSAIPNQEYVHFYVRRENGRVDYVPRLESPLWSDFSECQGARRPGKFPCSPLAPFDNPMRLIINQAIGGDWGGIGVDNYDAFNGRGVEFETSAVTVCEKL